MALPVRLNGYGTTVPLQLTDVLVPRHIEGMKVAVRVRNLATRQ